MDIIKILTSIREKIDPNFNFVDNTDQTIPFHNFKKSISKSKIVLISSGGFHLKKDKPFDTEDSKGDPTYRMIPKDTRVESIEISHSHYNHKYVNKDINCGFPIELLKELERKEDIGSLADKNYSFMGYCLKVEKLKENARGLAEKLKNEEVEAALIAPAWPVCNQSVGLIARELEQKDISTVTLNMFLDIAKKVIPPRTIHVNFPFGAPFGDPNNKSLQMKVIRESLSMLENSKKPGEIKKLPFDWRDELD